MAGCTFCHFPSAVRAVAARRKLPSALRPGSSQGVEVRTQEKLTKEIAAGEKELDKGNGKRDGHQQPPLAPKIRARQD